MGIPVHCPNGHHFSVKDKYAGKKGICPYCEGQVVVRVPNVLAPEVQNAYTQACREEKGRVPLNTDSSVFDSMPDEATPSASGSHLGSSVVRHNIRCQCGQSVPMWFAKCPKCGTFIEH
ncbi:MAG: hypothetical protein JNL18_10690 [Planctomycetaceae bacterium]|uniref:Double zinc ribbon n=1 Tax=Lacipirellula limnantheis TaxID=2528024 RepID=A0A517TUW7_9BACT|nr:hypothetical protein [Lacipirellula limnantheis]MBL9163191.1 hypothetical protein [Planctomycetaceae bacterium]QDT72147.1 hypothetical protein I41_13140 [Lacipirellula limnantheis]